MPTARNIARGLWIVWAIVVWNVVFDHVIVVAGREYIVAALAAARSAGPYARMDDWMRPAVTRGLWIATSSSALILLVGFVATRRDGKRRSGQNRTPRSAKPGSRMRTAPHPLIYDWNHDTVAPRPAGHAAMLNDETLRDGLQSPSVRTPTIDQRIAILHHMDALGIDTADVGLPGAGPRVASDVELLVRAIVEARLKIRPNCAARTLVADIKPIAEISQRTGVAIECGAFIGSSSIRQYAEGWTLDYLQKCTEDALTFAVKEGLPVMYVTEDTTRADPGDAAASVFHGDPGGRFPPVHSGHCRPRDTERRARPCDVRESFSS